MFALFLQDGTIFFGFLRSRNFVSSPSAQLQGPTVIFLLLHLLRLPHRPQDGEALALLRVGLRLVRFDGDHDGDVSEILQCLHHDEILARLDGLVPHAGVLAGDE